jgi:hypothetical protein
VDKVRGDDSFSHPIQEILGVDKPAEVAAAGPIARVRAGEEQAEAEVQERDESIEALAKDDVELC